MEHGFPYFRVFSAIPKWHLAGLVFAFLLVFIILVFASVSARKGDIQHTPGDPHG